MNTNKDREKGFIIYNYTDRKAADAVIRLIGYSLINRQINHQSYIL